MSKHLIVTDEILIEATPAKVWEILTKPEYVAQWDELPEDYPSEVMTEGSQVIWELPDGGKSITTIIKAEEGKELVISLFVSKWEVQPNEGDVAYRYQLEERGNHTLLKFEIGDFSLLSNGQMYYDASVEFASSSKEAIKQLAEK